MAQQPGRGWGGGPRRPGGPGQGPRRTDERPQVQSEGFSTLLQKISLASPGPDLFDGVAQQVASTLRPTATHGPNKRSQVRRFYDELLRFRARLPVAHKPAVGEDVEFGRALPFIRMLNARAAYAAERKGEGSNLVSNEFTAFLRRLLEDVKDRETLANACTMFEAVIGFMPPDK